jgi:adenylate cyclase
LWGREPPFVCGHGWKTPEMATGLLDPCEDAEVTDATGTRQLAAIMFTDMVGYTALMQQDERRAKANRDRHREVLSRLIAKQDGQVLQFYGDGTLSIFRSALDAVSCAIEIQSELRRQPRIPLRIGIHTGDIVYDEEGAYGDGVNVASRIESLATPGGILVSGKVFDEIKNHPHLLTRALGRVHLKNVARPVSVFAIATEGLDVASPESIQAKAGGLERSVAVLPFVNMSTDPENEFFTDGVTEEIINALARIRRLKVTSRTSSFAYKGHNQDVRTIGAELGVGTVLEGSVRRAGQRVRITAQLINTDDGYHIFSEAWNRDIDDIFEVQDEIARKIAEKLEAELSARQTVEPLVKKPTENLDAYNLYRKGVFYWNKWTPDSAHKALELFEEAIRSQPDFALPHSGVAYAAAFLGALGALQPQDIFPRAKRAAAEALELDDSIVESHLALALVRLFYEWDFEGARQCFETALELNPGSSDPHHTYALYLLSVNQADDAVGELEKALQLDPLSMPIRSSLAQALHHAGRPDDSIRECERMLELEPAFRVAYEGMGWCYVMKGDLDEATRAFERQARITADPRKGITGLGYVYAKAGRLEEARKCLRQVLERQQLEPHISVTMDLAILYAGLGDTDQVFVQLNRAIDERVGSLIFLDGQPFWEPYRQDPRFRAALARIGFPQVSSPG